MPMGNMEIAYCSQIKFDGTVLTFSGQVGRKMAKGALRGWENIPFTRDKSIHKAKLYTLFLPSYVCTVSRPYQAPVCVHQDFVFQRVMSEGGMVQGVCSAVGAAARK